MLVSIIIPIYNIEREYLVRCVESVCNQDYDELEILLVDDGSNDGTGNVCDELATTDKRIRVFHKENGGSSSARNLGLSKAKGEYIGFVDSDDYIDSDYVSLMMQAIRENNLVMAQISRDEIDALGNKLPDVCVPPTEELMISGRKQIEELLMHRGDCSFCTRLTKAELFEGRSFPEGRLNEDFFLLMQMLLGIDDKGNKIGKQVDSYMILPKQAYHVFYRIGSNSRRKDKEDFSRVFIDIVDNADWVEEAVAEYLPDMAEYAKRFALYQRLDYLLHIPISQMNDSNEFYVNVCRYIKDNRESIKHNGLLTKKNRLYLTLMSYNPRTIRKIHRVWLRIKQVS